MRMQWPILLYIYIILILKPLEEGQVPKRDGEIKLWKTAKNIILPLSVQIYDELQ